MCMYMCTYVHCLSNSRGSVQVAAEEEGVEAGEVKEQTPEEEDEEEKAWNWNWKRQRTDKSEEEAEDEQAGKRQRTNNNRNRSAGSKGEGKHKSRGKRGFRWMQRRLHDNRRAHRGTIGYQIPVALCKKGGKEQYVHTHVNG